MSEAQKDIRAGQTDPELLKDLGMSSEQFRDFVTKYTERFDKLRELAGRPASPAPDEADSPERAGDKGVRKGTSDLRNVTGKVRIQADETGRLADPQRQKTSKTYLRHVQEYFRAVSEAVDEGNIAPASRPSQ
jgi:hypothetical protein